MEACGIIPAARFRFNPTPMANLSVCTCDWCSKVIYGKEKAAFKHEDHIQLEGKVLFKKYNPAFRKYTFAYMSDTRYNMDDFTHFCSGACFYEFIKAQYDLAKKQAEDMILKGGVPGDRKVYDNDIVDEYASK